MISEIINILQSHKFYGVSESVDFAKGSDEMPTTLKKGFKKIKRKWQSKRK